MEQTKKLSGREYSAVVTWFAIGVLLKEAAFVLGDRAKRAAPGTYRDIRMLPRKVDSVLDNITRTIDKRSGSRSSRT